MIVPSRMTFAPGRLRLVWGTYRADGSPSLEALDHETGEPAATLTTCLGRGVPDGHLLVKDWSENEGALRTLVEAGVVEDTGQRIPTGYTAAALCRILRRAP